MGAAAGGHSTRGLGRRVGESTHGAAHCKEFLYACAVGRTLELIAQTTWASLYNLIKLQCGSSTGGVGIPGSRGPGQGAPTAQAGGEAERVDAVGGIGNVGYRAVR